MTRPPDDPFLWLEAIDGPEATAWVDAQNAGTEAALQGDRLATDRQAALAILTADDRIPTVAMRGPHLYNFWTDKHHERGLWRRTTLESYRSAAPEWDILLDLDALCAAEAESWVWRGCTTLPPAHVRGLVMLSRGGADAIVVREFDLVARRFVEDGFVSPEAKTFVDWEDEDTLLIGTSRAAATDSGYPRTMQRWRRGTALEAAEQIFEGQKSDMLVSTWRDHRAGRTLLNRQIGFWTSQLHVVPDGAAPYRLDVPDDCMVQLGGDLLTILLRTDWIGHRAGSLLVIGLSAFAGGDRDFVTLFAGRERASIENWLTFDDHVILDVLDNLESRILYASAAEGWRPRRVGGLPDGAAISIGRLDVDHETDDLAFVASGFLTPTSLYFGRRDAAAALVKQGASRFDAAGLVVTRHDALAADGTLIPYFQVGRPDVADAFVRLDAYGGFDISMLPHYVPIDGKLWLEDGHIYVLACLRGGGEFGPAWHEAGRREGKKRAQDDLAAVARDLFRRGVTTPQRLAAEGGSNGGLLIGNMLTRHPALYGALVCQIPLLDMYRYTKLLAGASWIAEYGDPEKPEDWAFLREVSAYHLLESEQAYPPVLFTTTRRDDRVHPGHARKMAAAMQALGYPALFHEQVEGGHGIGVDDQKRAADIALRFAFVRQALGIG